MKKENKTKRESRVIKNEKKGVRHYSYFEYAVLKVSSTEKIEDQHCANKTTWTDNKYRGVSLPFHYYVGTPL
ncbi:predicted protein [Sclerotinia sclerotiorum 1980 UF-70]|uniref:Uncharacterized protein n=1 Tax=Sclerotinia sclerotiorum (strain ATCC 18683 / 1980 / Ss-1) TaxID=665079 RepID=A7EIN0_SCLS1|nr:predicted protein [Sclerotinia sclerotiorum 1980 UF-70]EDO02696.1 predicted protein [Sclerotinia sclerotiorum 1980 UF-70]